MLGPAIRRIGLFVVLIALAGCTAGPVDELWPPFDQSSSSRVDVVRRGIHTFIVLYPTRNGESVQYREYGFAETDWYLKGKRGIRGVLRALFRPSDSLVEIKDARFDAFITDQVGVDERWTFMVSPEGRRAMVRFLESWYDPEDLIARADGTRYFRGRHSYHLFRGCHHYTARALRAAGLPIRPWWAFNEHLMAWQLDRTQKNQPLMLSV